MMLIVDPKMHMDVRQRQLMEEAEHERLLAQLPHTSGGFKRGLALACVKLANWLDAPAGYVQLPEPGPEDLTIPWASV